MIRVLVLDDERELREEVAAYLLGLGYAVTEVGSIKQFHQYFGPDKFDVLLIDRILPDGDGLDLVSELRAASVRCGIVMFTAKDGTKDRIEGFKTGADHYVSKPVRLDELGALIKVLAWRLSPMVEWRLDKNHWTLIEPGGSSIHLTTQEFDFLSILAKNRNKAVSRASILNQLGKNPEKADPRNLDALVLRLRKKIEEATSHPLPIKTVHGVGYMVSQVAEGD
ncbi:response regulator transcription factor [Limnohabitans sp. Hippo4]|uniref:response regulator transcription factor n=1 Tax=Limnohabitans sp. Hippo4 TaxID=1826167 RepID=UPI000D3A4286|nr:response regulator transcription factor [Limnohabitans sp. Hippo4]PUE37962.1 hypothetical protein B9Z46_04595 [Limnohabitans sp. Hippo4]